MIRPLWPQNTLQASKGTELNAFASTNDTKKTQAQVDNNELGGGKSTIDNNAFYYCITEFDKDGYVVFDGEWQPVQNSWVIGQSSNEKTYKDWNGYPVYEEGESLDGGYETDEQIARRNNVAYSTITFRLNNGDVSIGSGWDQDIDLAKLQDNYTQLHLVFNDFAYTIKDENGNTTDTWKRLGLATPKTSAGTKAKLTEPTKTGYTARWKIKMQQYSRNRK